MMNQQPEQSHAHTQTCRAGFTLFEMVIVAGIIGALLAFIIPQINQYIVQSKVKTTRNMLLQIKMAITTYENDTGMLPSTLKDLVVKPQNPELSSKWTKGGYMGGKKQMPKDSWSNAFQYKLTPDGEYQYELYSWGPDGRKAPKADWINVHNL